MLADYKPPKTSRICIHLNAEHLNKPIFFGSICQINGRFEADKFFGKSKYEQYKYLVTIIHKSILRTADIYSWNDEPFVNAYESVCSSGFQFALVYPSKKSRDRKKRAQISIDKTETKTIITLNLTIENRTDRIKLLESTNFYWYDPAYFIAKASKWLGNEKFGAFDQKNGKFLFYSLTENSIMRQ